MYLCSRCVTWVDTKIVDNQIGFLGRGRKTEINFFTQPLLDTSIPAIWLNTMSISLADICPVGAFTVDIDKYTARIIILKQCKRVIFLIGAGIQSV